MGKQIVIKDADFSNVAVSEKKYLYNISDDDFLNIQNSISNLDFVPYIIKNQQKLRNKELTGIRLNVSVIGKFTLYKCSQLPINDTPSGTIQFTKLFILSTNKLGIQNINFPSKVILNNNEYIVIGSEYNIDKDTLKFKYDKNSNTDYNTEFMGLNIGSSSYVTSINQKLLIDFYTNI